MVVHQMKGEHIMDWVGIEERMNEIYWNHLTEEEREEINNG